MNEPAPSPAAPSWFRPGLFLAGLGIGLVVLAWLGREAAAHNTHPGFVRLHPRVSPEGNYYPTLDELCAITRAQVRPGQRLVLIGGNSVFNGVGQPADRLWTHELQRLLGDKFAVVNLAMRGALIMDGAAVVAEVLRDEFPDLIYVANGSPFTPPYPVGEQVYQYLLWEAYFRGRLLDDGPRRAALETYLMENGPWLPARRHGPPESLRERSLKQWDKVVATMHRTRIAGEVTLDRVLKYRDLWNWVGYEKFFTVPSFYTPRWPGWTAPRGKLADEEQDYETLPLDSPHRYAPGKTEGEMAIVRGFTSGWYEADGRGGWTLRAGAKEDFVAQAHRAVPPPLRARTLVMLSRNSPFYRERLTPAEQVRDDLAYRDSAEAWRLAGFRAQEYGRDFTAADYGDRTHLSVAGGRKLAVVVAAEVRALIQAEGKPTR